MLVRLLRLAVCVAAVVIAARTAPAQHRPDDRAVHAALDALLTDLHGRGWFDGALVAGRGDTVLYARGFGYANVAEGVPFTPRTPADGGSLAKTVTAAALWMLQEDGVLALDDPVARHLPGYPYAGTTVGDLITHRAGGLPGYDHFFESIRPDSVLTNARLLDVLRENPPPLQYPPGERFVYDSPAYDLAALVVERATRRPFEVFLRDRIAGPLGIGPLELFARPARFADWPGVRTLSYQRKADSLVVFDVWDGEGFHGGSNLYFSAEALYRWVTSFYTAPVLGAATLAAGLRPAVLDDGRPTGINPLSWYGDGTGGRFQYPGVLQGFHSVGYWDAERRFSFGFVTNSNMPQGLRPLLVRAVAGILETGRPTRIALPDRPLLGDGLAAVAGSYDLDGFEKVELTLEAGAAFVRLADGPVYRAYQVDPATLYVPGLDAWVTFGELQNGRFQQIHWTTVFHSREGPRIR